MGNPAVVGSAHLAQAERLARHRSRLVASGAYAVEELRALRHDSDINVTSSWLARHVGTHGLFGVPRDGEMIYPCLQFTAEGQLRPHLKSVLEVLAMIELGGWATWTWLSSQSAWLDGRVPAELLDEDRGAVLTAARRFCSNAL